MRIGLDLRMLSGGSGISRYISELSMNILEKDKTNLYVLFFNKIDQEARAYEKFGYKMIETNVAHYSYNEQFKLPQILNREKLDLVHFPHFNVPLLYRKPFVVTIHDLTHTFIPGTQKTRWHKRLAYNLVIWNAVKFSKKIIAVSQNTKKQITDHFRISGDKIEVIYEGTSAVFKMMNKQDAFKYVSNRFGITKPYILFVGVWRRYKNVENLSAAFDKLKDRGLDYQLVLVGEPDLFYPGIKEKVMNIKHAQDLKAVGRVSDEDLPYFYNGADLFVLPSVSEGFGLTALEAASCGVAIACSDIPTLREVMGSGAAYFDPNNPDNMTDVLFDLLQKPERLEELANLGLSRTKHFSWKQACQETIKIYESII